MLKSNYKQTIWHEPQKAIEEILLQVREPLSNQIMMTESLYLDLLYIQIKKQ